MFEFDSCFQHAFFVERCLIWKQIFVPFDLIRSFDLGHFSNIVLSTPGVFKTFFDYTLLTKFISISKSKKQQTGMKNKLSKRHQHENLHQ